MTEVCLTDIYDLGSAFDAAWRNHPDNPPSIEEFVAPVEESRRNRVTALLIQIDLEWRWGRGETPDVAEYLKRFPLLKEDGDALLEMLVVEVRQRKVAGLDVDLAEYASLYSVPADRLERSLAQEDGLRTLDYVIGKEIGRGGMGEVYLARQKSLDRVVALKVVRRDCGDAVGFQARFIAEGKYLARLDHPNVLRVYDSGLFYDPALGKSVLYLAMEYAEGGSLESYLKKKGGRLTPKEAARVVEQLAGGVAAVHKLGFIHRDVKPANVLFDKEDGTPKLADFGLARSFDHGDTQPGGDAGTGTIQRTAAGVFLGTAAYAAPEQARGEQVGPPADVYSLGVILYECLVGKLPIVGDTLDEMLKRVQTAEPVPPRAIDPKVPRDLEAICLKCLHKNPNERYSTAAELADDLRRWREVRPVAARRAGRLERAGMAVRRQPVIALLTLAIGLALVGGTVASTLFGLRAREQEGKAKQALAQTEEALAEGLLRPIGQDVVVLEPTYYELQALGQLASLPAQSDRVRMLFLEKALARPETARQLAIRIHEATTAAVGLRLDLRQQALGIARERLRDPSAGKYVRLACVRMMAALEEDDPEWCQLACQTLSDDHRWSIRGNDSSPLLLGAFRDSGVLAARLPKDEISRMALEDYVRWDLAEWVSSEIPHDLAAIDDLARHLTLEQAEAIADEYYSRQMFSREISEDLSDWKRRVHFLPRANCFAALVDIVLQSKQEQGIKLSERLLGYVIAHDLEIGFAHRHATLAQRLPKHVAENQSAELATGIITGAVRAKDIATVRDACHALVALAPRLQPQEADKFASRLANLLAPLVAAKNDRQEITKTCEAFAVLAPRLGKMEAEKQANALLEQVVSQEELDGDAFEAIAPYADKQQASRLASKIIGQRPTTGERYKLRNYDLIPLMKWLTPDHAGLLHQKSNGSIKQHLASQLDPKRQAEICEEIIASATKRNKEKEVADREEAFVILAPRLPPALARKAASALLAASSAFCAEHQKPKDRRDELTARLVEDYGSILDQSNALTRLAPHCSGDQVNLSITAILKRQATEKAQGEEAKPEGKIARNAVDPWHSSSEGRWLGFLDLSDVLPFASGEEADRLADLLFDLVVDPNSGVTVEGFADAMPKCPRTLASRMLARMLARVERTDGFYQAWAMATVLRSLHDIATPQERTAIARHLAPWLGGLPPADLAMRVQEKSRLPWGEVWFKEIGTGKWEPNCQAIRQIAVLAPHLPPEDLVELLKSPALNREERALLREHLAKRLGLSVRTHWGLVRQLAERSPQFDLSSPLRLRPSH